MQRVTTKKIVWSSVMSADTGFDFGATTRPSAKLGMWLFLVADAMSFAALLLSYGVLRLESHDWPPSGSRLGIPFTAGLTFLLICSSVTMVFAVAAAQQRRRGALVCWLMATMLGGLLFLAGQAHEYSVLIRDKGMGLTVDQMSATFFVCTGFHGAHVLTGVILLGIVAVRAARGRYAGSGPVDGVEVAGLFWHFVDLVWILVFTLVYLI
jgi:heme/copper-type cytochrome/quinol oxidase subunit 3